ncbi:hypothetical protein ACC691_39650, partial [Rhizobium johnstonii]|uniref:hypothetical protein n=1 Tax=Rhizobium johnstonii TaxID=3019933 RepID=UPI003F974E5F
GYADEGEAELIASACLDGRVVERFYRGRSSLSHPVQAAQHYARLEFGDDRIEAYPPASEQKTPNGWRVELADGGGAITVDLVETSS